MKWASTVIMMGPPRPGAALPEPEEDRAHHTKPRHCRGRRRQALRASEARGGRDSGGAERHGIWTSALSRFRSRGPRMVLHARARCAAPEIEAARIVAIGHRGVRITRTVLRGGAHAPHIDLCPHAFGLCNPIEDRDSRRSRLCLHRHDRKRAARRNRFRDRDDGALAHHLVPPTRGGTRILRRIEQVRLPLSDTAAAGGIVEAGLTIPSRPWFFEPGHTAPEFSALSLATTRSEGN